VRTSGSFNGDDGIVAVRLHANARFVALLMHGRELNVEDPTFECDLTVLFTAGSSLTVEGPFDLSAGEADWAITGGTGRYKTAHGELHLDFSDGETNFLTAKVIL
jgi:hypothetical protein